MLVNTQKETKRKGIIREYAEAILIAIILAVFIRTFVVQAFKIPSASMVPTLQVGDHILVNKFIYGVKIPFIRKTIIPLRKPKRGDVIVFIFPKDRSKDFIKRVIGIEGDTVEIVNKKVYINGKPFNDPYGVHNDNFIFPKRIEPRDNFGPVTVPKDAVFVMGDNRDNSRDSRFWGFVKLKDIEGKAFIIYWSWDNFSIKWNRIGKLIH
ncbi:MAG TPA: signal peptidase I [Syntrophaceae bacterium]|nr:signal peptidase I [Syntrophaceae bacterium]